MRLITVISTIALVASFSLAAVAQPDSADWKACNGDSDSDSVIIARCAAVVASKDQSAEHKAVAHKNLCLAYNDLGNHDRAIHECDEAIGINPDYIEAFVFRGHAYFNKNEFDRAILDYDKAIALGSKAATTLVQRAAAYHRKGDATPTRSPIWKRRSGSIPTIPSRSISAATPTGPLACPLGPSRISMRR